MAEKSPRLPGLHVTFVLFISWTLMYICLGLKKDPRSQFYGHAVMHPAIYIEAREKRDVNFLKLRNEEKLSVSFSAFDKEFVLDLFMNSFLLPSHYFEKHHENGTHVSYSPLKDNPSHCHYQGFVRGINYSLVAVSTCNGLSGIINDGSEMYYIQPDFSASDDSHFLFRAKDLIPQNLTCGVSDSSNFLKETEFLKSFKRSKRSAVLQDPYQSNAKSRYVELIIVNDNKEFREFKEDKNAVFERSKQIANIVNGLYAPLNIFIALVGVIIWSDHDEIKLTTDGDATLTNFLNYRREKLAQEHPNDNAQLITAMTFDGGVVGKALKGPICTYEYSGGVNMDHSHVVGLVATTVAHELGHNFGMEHDTDECQCPDDKCIMAPSSSSTSPRHWSSCSLEYLDLAYSQGMDYCLKNHPDNIIGPVCGNGFLEKGEECDCGLQEFCDNQCCNATSCQLFPNATCAVGGCCDLETCQVKKVATICRNIVSECDLPEYCDGLSEFCPVDTYLQNGKECGKGKAYCYDGECKSHVDQCKLLWGHTGKVSDHRCFEQNYKGNVNGNCGYNRINQTYKACRKEDILCGMLHCTHLNERLEFGMESAAILARSYINVKGKTFTCRSAIIDLGLFSTDPGLTPNGAKCGDGKICVNQKCIPVSTMKIDECLNNCNGNGVCNNKGNCHCDNGYSPPYCASYGPGGSIDSGPASDPSNYLFVIAMYAVFLGIFPLMLFLLATLYYYRCHIKIWWSKKVQKADIKSRAKTATLPKSQPPSKFNFDRNILRTLEISGPIQIPPPASATHRYSATLPHRSSKSIGEKPPGCLNLVSSLYPNITENSKSITTALVPIRPAPIRPDGIPEKPLLKSPSVNVSAAVTRTYSLKSPHEKYSRPLSSSSFRPSCPPPRPPTLNINNEHERKQGNVTYAYEDVSKNTDVVERSATPNSLYYDDCQTLDTKDTPSSSTYLPNKNNTVDKSSQNHKTITPHQEQSQCSMNNSIKRTLNTRNQKPVLSKAVLQTSKTLEKSVVAELAQKFEKQEIIPEKNVTPNTSVRPPFKYRPLPPRPGDTEV